MIYLTEISYDISHFCADRDDLSQSGGWGLARPKTELVIPQGRPPSFTDMLIDILSVMNIYVFPGLSI